METVQRPGTSTRPGFITELHGMRGLALAMVVLFHLFGNGRVSGGVDVFLVISGFLLTGSLCRRLTAGEHVSLTVQYGRMFARLLPGALVVLCFVAVMTLLVLPESSWVSIYREILASGLYFENWELIRSQLSYGAAGPQTSPLQHFWSLSVQGQFFLIWPLLLLLVAAAARRVGADVRIVIAVLAIGLTTFSFAYATYLVGVEQQVAYFSSYARFWELGAGAVAALVVWGRWVPDPLRGAMVWLGCLLVVTSGFVVDGAHTFPGPWALWPVLGILLVIAGSGSRTRFGLDRVLDLPPLRVLADVSYPLYLWHWPLLIFYLDYRNQQQVGWRSATALLVLSLAAAWLTRQALERPTLTALPTLGSGQVLVAVVATLVVLGASVRTAETVIDHRQDSELAALSIESPDHPGARVMFGDGDGGPWTESARPAPALAPRDRPDLYERGCMQEVFTGPGLDEVLVCEDEAKPQTPSRTIVMSGGSHVVQWYPAMKLIAARENWELVVINKDGCRLALDSDTRNVSSCAEWNRSALPMIIDRAPDAVITVGTRTWDDARERVNRGQIVSWDKLNAAGIPVIAIRDTPRFEEAVPACLLGHENDPAVCGRRADEVFRDLSPLTEAHLPPDVAQLDLTRGFCTDYCEPIIGNVVAYYDDDHMSATYSRSLAPALLQALERRAPWLF